MAGITFDLQVFSAQRESGVALVDEDYRLPCFLHVAGLAVFAVAAPVPFLAVIPFMAVEAGRRKFFAEPQILMAALTLGIPMFIAQRETGVPVMVKAGRILPFCLGMTALAFFSERAFVRVVLAMARIAVGGGFRLRDGFAVTRFALDRLMPSAQREMRVVGMPERRGFPKRVVVAFPAAGAEAALVGIVLAMAGDAVAGRAGKALIDMAIGALGFGMTVQQRESRFGMVEARLLPVALVVAVGAFCAQAALVPVILAVAGEAVGRRRAVFRPRAMAAHAGRTGMLAA